MFVTVLSETFYLHPAFYIALLFLIQSYCHPFNILFFFFYVLHEVIYIALSSTNISSEKEV